MSNKRTDQGQDNGVTVDPVDLDQAETKYNDDCQGEREVLNIRFSGTISRYHGCNASMRAAVSEWDSESLSAISVVRFPAGTTNASKAWVAAGVSTRYAPH